MQRRLYPDRELLKQGVPCFAGSPPDALGVVTARVDMKTGRGEGQVVALEDRNRIATGLERAEHPGQPADTVDDEPDSRGIRRDVESPREELPGQQTDGFSEYGFAKRNALRDRTRCE
jgi:hypothetical protein